MEKIGSGDKKDDELGEDRETVVNGKYKKDEGLDNEDIIDNRGFSEPCKEQEDDVRVL